MQSRPFYHGRPSHNHKHIFPRRRKSWKRALLVSAPNSGMHQTLVRKRSEDELKNGRGRGWAVFYSTEKWVLGDRKEQSIFLQDEGFGPHPKQNPAVLGPQKRNLCASFPGKERQKGTHINFLRGTLGSKKGFPNGPSLATKKFMHIFLPLRLPSAVVTCDPLGLGKPVQSR